MYYAHDTCTYTKGLSSDIRNLSIFILNIAIYTALPDDLNQLWAAENKYHYHDYISIQDLQCFVGKVSCSWILYSRFIKISIYNGTYLIRHTSLWHSKTYD